MKKLAYNLVLALLICLTALCFVGCNKQRLSKPSGLYIDEMSLVLSWNTIKDARGYVINVNGEDIKTVSAKKYSLEDLPAGEYKIKVKAVAGKDFKDSNYSYEIDFVREQETGLDYKLINNNKEYAVCGVKDAKIENYSTGTEYRGRPVTAIYLSAFSSNTDIKSLVIENTVTVIQDNAFSGSTIESVTFSEGLQSIGTKAFKSCSNLTEINLPDSLTTISANAFSYCTSLTSVEIGSGVTTLGDSVFSGCSKLTEITIPDSVTSIGATCFEKCRNLTDVNLGNGVKSLGKQAFTNCDSLKNVNFGTALETIGEAAFYFCKELETLELPSSLKDIGQQAFYKCTALSNVTLGDNLTHVGAYAFDDTAIFNESENSIIYVDDWVVGNKNSLIDDTAISEIQTKTVRGIADSTFSKCTAITEIALPVSCVYIGSYAFSGCTSLGFVTLGSDTLSLGSYAFSGCTKLSSCTGFTKLEEIGSYAFYGCKNLKTITLPDTVKSIGTYAFNSSGLYKGNADGVVYIGKWIVGYTSTTPNAVPLQLTEGTVGISDYAFFSSALGDVLLPSSLEYFGYGAFYGSSITSVSIPSQITYLPEYCFAKCTKLLISDVSVDTIGYGAFAECAGISSLRLHDVSSLGEYAFYSCNSMETLILQDVDYIPNAAFGNCVSLNTVIMSNVNELGRMAFYKCDKLSDVAFGTTLETIGEYAFANCNGLISLDIPSSVKSVGDYAFYKCTGISDITFGDGIETIGNDAFFKCESLAKINIPDSVQKIGEYAFRGCVALTDVIVPGTLEEIGLHAFYGCKALTLYCELDEKSDGYDEFWNSSYCVIAWSTVLSDDGEYVVSVKAGDKLENISTLCPLGNPHRDGYEFSGWSLNSDLSTVDYTSETVINAENGVTLYAVWSEIDDE